MRAREGMETEIENHVKWLDERTYKLKWEVWDKIRLRLLEINSK